MSQRVSTCSSSSLSNSNVSYDAYSSVKQAASWTPGILSLTWPSGVSCSPHCTYISRQAGSHAWKKGVAENALYASSLDCMNDQPPRTNGVASRRHTARTTHLVSAPHPSIVP